MIIQLTVYIFKFLYNWLYILPHEYKSSYVHSQMIMQLTIYISKWQYNWLSTNDNTIEYIHSQMALQLTVYIVKLL